MSNELYIDKWGQIWQRINETTVWNQLAGFGLWDNGKGLKPYPQQSKDTSNE